MLVPVILTVCGGLKKIISQTKLHSDRYIWRLGKLIRNEKALGQLYWTFDLNRHVFEAALEVFNHSLQKILFQSVFC